MTSEEIGEYISWYAGEYTHIPTSRVLQRTRDHFEGMKETGIRRKDALALIRKARHLPEPSEVEKWKYTPKKHRKRIYEKEMVVSKFKYHIKYRSDRMGHSINLEIDAGAVALTEARSKKLCMDQLQLFLDSSYGWDIMNMGTGAIKGGKYKRGYFKEDYTGGFYDFKSVVVKREDYSIKVNGEWVKKPEKQ